MAKEKSSGAAREQKLAGKIKEMESLIENYQSEYDEKKKALDELDETIKLAKEDSGTLIEKYKEEARQTVLKELDEKIKATDEALDNAIKKEEEAKDLKSEAQKMYSDTMNQIKEQKKQFETEKKNAMQEADNYCKEKKSELEAREKVVEKSEKELEDVKKELNAKDHAQAALQNELDKKQADAELGFQTLLREERVKFDKELSRVKDEIAEQGKKIN